MLCYKAKAYVTTGIAGRLFAHEKTSVGISDKSTGGRKSKIYNLDVIISIGYRVKSKNGVIFRQWANRILKDYMLKGYAVNQRRLEYLEKTIQLIDIANRIDKRLEGNDAKEILKVIGDYSKALDLLDDYDHRTLKKIEGNLDDRKIEYQECINIINKLRFNEESSLFAVERDKGSLASMEENAAKFGVHNVEIVSDLTEEALKDKPVPRLAFLVAQKDTIEQDIVTLKKINPDMKIIIYTLELDILSDIPYLFKKHGVNLSEVMQISVSKTDKDSVFVAQPAPWIISGE